MSEVQGPARSFRQHPSLGDEDGQPPRLCQPYQPPLQAHRLLGCLDLVRAFSSICHSPRLHLCHCPPRQRSPLRVHLGYLHDALPSGRVWNPLNLGPLVSHQRLPRREGRCGVAMLPPHRRHPAAMRDTRMIVSGFKSKRLDQIRILCRRVTLPLRNIH